MNPVVLTKRTKKDRIAYLEEQIKRHETQIMLIKISIEDIKKEKEKSKVKDIDLVCSPAGSQHETG